MTCSPTLGTITDGVFQANTTTGIGSINVQYGSINTELRLLFLT